MKWSKFSGNGTIDNDTYQDFKEKAINNINIVRKVVKLSELNIVSTTKISYKDVEFNITENAFKNLVRILGLTIGVMDSIGNTLGDKVSSSLLSMMKKSISSNGDLKICIIFNKELFSVTGFTENANGLLSNNAFFKMFEDTMNNASDMDIRNMSISPTGDIDISVLNNNWEFDLKGFNEEFFKSGLTFTNTSDLTKVSSFNERLSCLNGMIADNFEGSSIILNGNNPNIDTFYNVVTNLNGIKGFEDIFKSRIRTMMNTQASLDELNSVYKAFEHQTKNLDDKFVRVNLESFIPLTEVKHAFKKEGISLSGLGVKQKQKVRTGITMWELVNNMTDLSSHPTKYGLKFINDSHSVSQLQRVSGNIAFKKQYDLESPVRQLF